MEWYLKVLKENYANFNGRARRSEYWYFILFNYIALFAVHALSIGLAQISSILGGIVGLVALVYTLATIVPTIAVAVRRLHDSGKSGWLLLLYFVPIANFYVLYLYIIEGTPGDNEFGSNPKMIG